MSAKAKPWMKFYAADWRANVKLRMCSLAARGLWIEMICLMHQGEPYGHLTVPDSGGKPPSIGQLAVLVGAAVQEVETLLAELESTSVFFKTTRGIIYSRRMIEDEKKAQTAVENGRGGGNPTLRKQTTISPSDNHHDNHHLNGHDNQGDKARARTYARVPEGFPPKGGNPKGAGAHARGEPHRDTPSSLGLDARSSSAPLTLPSGVKWDGTGPHPRFAEWFDRVRLFDTPGGMTWMEDLWGPPPGQPGSAVSSQQREVIIADAIALGIIQPAQVQA